MCEINCETAVCFILHAVLLLHSYGSNAQGETKGQTLAHHVACLLVSSITGCISHVFVFNTGTANCVMVVNVA